METNEMKLLLEEDPVLQNHAMIKVIGVGGGGSNAVNSMIHDKADQVEYWVFNTDSQALSFSPCENKLVLGKNVTKGLGAGGDPASGKAAALDSYEDIKKIVSGADMIFIAVGEGGGTGTGASPIVAKAAKEAGCLVMGIVTRPFNFEGKKKKTNALEGINALKENVDALLVVSNDKLMISSGSEKLVSAFSSANHVLAESVKTVTDLILIHGIVNLDFADVRNLLSGSGIALIGFGQASGDNRAIKAADSAINSPLLESSIRGANTILLNFTIGEDVTLIEVQDAVNYITQSATGKENSDVDIEFGIQLNENEAEKEMIKIAIIATNFNKEIDFNDLPTRQVSIQAPSEEKKDLSSFAKDGQSVLPDYLRNRLGKDQVISKVEVEEKEEEIPTPAVPKEEVVEEEEEEEEPEIISPRF
ncbi:MAG: cell division protein FtsZ [Bacilli bacterium]|nr:cell division protein FtsZ [Bacilli bacterium]